MFTFGTLNAAAGSFSVIRLLREAGRRQLWKRGHVIQCRGRIKWVVKWQGGGTSLSLFYTPPCACELSAWNFREGLRKPNGCDMLCVCSDSVAMFSGPGRVIAYVVS